MSGRQSHHPLHQLAQRVAVTVLVCFLWVPASGRAILMAAGALTLPVSVMIGLYRYRPARPVLWWSLALTGTLWGLTILPHGGAAHAHAHGPGFTMHDALAAIGYLVIIGGILAAARRATNDRPGQVVLDMAIFTVGCVAVVWSFAVGVGPREGTTLTSLFSPFLDVLAVIAAGRLALFAGGAPSAVLLLLSMSMLTAGDMANLIITTPDTGCGQSGALWFLASYACAATAALHPSMARVGHKTVQGAPYLERVHLTAMAVASVMPPLMLLRERETPDVAAAGPLVAMSGLVFVLVVVRLERMRSVVDEQRVQLESLARTDHLTSLPNRRTGEAEMRRMRQEAIEQSAPLVVALLDLDHFKAYNDRYGHPAGDQLLEATASGWRRALPPDVFLSRHGGEEFLMLAKGRHPDNVRLLLEGLRGVSRTAQTFSAGVAVWDGVESLTTLLARADAALYSAKDQGRDRVEVTRPRVVVLTDAQA